jgi:hypothetical protein
VTIAANPACADSLYLALKYGQALRSGCVLHVSPEVLIIDFADLGLCSEQLAVRELFGLVERKPRRTITRNELPSCLGDGLGKT